MTPQERAGKIVQEYVPILKDVKCGTTSDITLREHLQEAIAAHIQEAEWGAAAATITLELHEKIVRHQMKVAFETTKERAFEIASDNGTNCCECAKQIRAMTQEEEKK